MKIFFKPKPLVLALTVLGTMASAFAHASCTYDPYPDPSMSAWLSQQAISAADLQAAASTLRQSGSASVVTAAQASAKSIVGLWKFMFISKGSEGIPDGTVLDVGYVTWHADGTELTNSSRPPRSGDFCMGVYKKTGSSSYKLHHVTLAWDPTGESFVGPGTIHEQVTLAASGNRYSGTFAINQYAQDGITLLALIKGRVAATRITAD